MAARPDAPQGNLATETGIFFSFASVSVSPHHAISGSVNTTAGIAFGIKTDFLPARTSATTLPSWVALCASIGSPATSPIANILGSDVLISSFTRMNPFESVSAFVFSSPSPPLFGFLPTQMSTLSNSISCFSFPAFSSSTRIPFPVSFSPVNLVSSIMSLYIPSDLFWSTLTRSLSTPGISTEVISTTDTSVPSAE